MTPTDNYVLESVIPQLESSSKLYYIYNKDEVACLNIIELLEKNPLINSKLVLYGINSDSSNLNVDDLQNLFKNSDEFESVLIYLFKNNDLEQYINLYNNGLTFPGKQYNMNLLIPLIKGEASNQLNGKFNVITFKGTNTSIIWRKGYEELGENNYSSTALNILNMLNTLVEKKNINNINSHFSILQFDPVSRDIIYPTFLVETFRDGKYNNTFLSVDDPDLGKYQATFIE